MHLFLYEAFARDKLPAPKVLCYDDACHLLQFLRNRCHRAEEFGYSKFACWFLYVKQVKIVCDRFHFPNHKNNPFCKANVDPSKCKELGPRTNTMAAEEARTTLRHCARAGRSHPRRSHPHPAQPPHQAFAWLARSKHIFRKMNRSRFFFLMLRLIELRNRWLEERP